MSRSTLMVAPTLVRGEIRATMASEREPSPDRREPATVTERRRGWVLLNAVHQDLDEESSLAHLSTDELTVHHHMERLKGLKPWAIASRLKTELGKLTEARRNGASTSSLTDEQLLPTVALLRRHAPFLAAHPLPALLRYTRACRVLHCRPDTALFDKGEDDRGGFFVVLTGSVRVDAQHQETEQGSKAMRTYTQTLRTGECFGELNVMYGIPRTAAVRTVATCELLVLEPQLFLELFADGMSRMAAEAAIFMKQCINALSALPPRCVASLANFASKVTFPRGRTIELDASTRVYFMRQGCCRLLCEDPDPPAAQDARGDAKGTKAIMLELGVLEKGSVFGLSGLFNELRQRWQCRADTPLQLYAVPHDLFVRCDSRVVAAVREQAAFRQTYFLGRRGMLHRPDSPPVVSLSNDSG